MARPYLIAPRLGLPPLFYDLVLMISSDTFYRAQAVQKMPLATNVPPRYVSINVPRIAQDKHGPRKFVEVITGRATN